MVFGLKNGLTFESRYILSTMSDNIMSGDIDSLPLRLNTNVIENIPSADTQQENQLPDVHQPQLMNSSLRTPMRVQVEYPDSITRKRRHQSSSTDPVKKIYSVNSTSEIEQFKQGCLEDDELLSQVADFRVSNESIAACSNDISHLTPKLSDTARVFARCYSLETEKSPKKGKVIVYDSDGLGGDSD